MSNHEKTFQPTPPGKRKLPGRSFDDTETRRRAGSFHMEGWIKLHRKVRDNWIWEDPVKFQWWIDILLEVNHSGRKIPIGFEVIECDRGQTIMSLNNWAKRWKVSKDTARNFLRMLEKDSMILHENLSKTTRITVCNYDTYQSNVHDDRTVSTRRANDDRTRTGTNKNDKNDKKRDSAQAHLTANFMKDAGWDDHPDQRDYLTKYFPKLFKLRNPLTYDQHRKLISKYTQERVIKIYGAMENNKPLLQKNESAYLTANKWLEQ